MQNGWKRIICTSRCALSATLTKTTPTICTTALCSSAHPLSICKWRRWDFSQTVCKCVICGPASAIIRRWIFCMTNWKASYPATVCRRTSINFMPTALWPNFTAPASKMCINFWNTTTCSVRRSSISTTSRCFPATRGLTATALITVSKHSTLCSDTGSNG